MWIKNPAKTFHIVIKLRTGGYHFTTIHEARKIAIGRAFGELDGDGESVAFCKATEELTEDERWQWGVQTSLDEARWHRSYSRTPMSELDMY